MTKLRSLDQLIDVASRVLGEKGAENFSLDDIAAEFGMHRSSLYYYISNKAELLDLVERQRLVVIADEIKRITLSSEPPRQKLLTAIQAHLRHIDRFYPESKTWNPLRSDFVTEPAEDDEGAKLASDIGSCFRAIIEDGMASGEFSCIGEPRIVAFAILGMCNWVTRWYRKGGKLSIDEISEMFIRLIEAGLVPATADASPPATALRRR